MDSPLPGHNTLLGDTLAALHASARRRIPFFLDCLREACAVSPPPYGEAWYGEVYRRRASDPAWLADLFAGYSAEECRASQRLATLRGRGFGVFTQLQDRLLKRHQADEARHVASFLEYSEAVFPDRAVGYLKNELHTDAQRVGGESVASADVVQLATEIIDINIGEVKNRVHLVLMRDAALRHAGPDRLELVRRVADRMVRDEVSHVFYTALVLQGFVGICHSQDLLQRYIERFASFNEQIRQEMNGVLIVQ